MKSSCHFHSALLSGTQPLTILINQYFLRYPKSNYTLPEKVV